MKLKGLRRSFHISYVAIYHLALRQHVEAQLAANAAKKKSAKKKPKSW